MRPFAPVYNAPREHARWATVLRAQPCSTRVWLLVVQWRSALCRATVLCPRSHTLVALWVVPPWPRGAAEALDPKEEARLKLLEQRRAKAAAVNHTDRVQLRREAMEKEAERVRKEKEEEMRRGGLRCGGRGAHTHAGATAWASRLSHRTLPPVRQWISL